MSSSQLNTLSLEQNLLTEQNAPEGIVTLVAGTLYVVDAKGTAVRLREYREGDFYHRKGVLGYPSFNSSISRDRYHQRSSYFASYRKTLHRGLIEKAPVNL